MVKWIAPRWPDLVYDILSILIMWLLFQMIHFRFGQKRRMSLNRKMILTLKHWRRTSISWITQTEMKEGLFLKMVIYISLSFRAFVSISTERLIPSSLSGVSTQEPVDALWIQWSQATIAGKDVFEKHLSDEAALLSKRKEDLDTLLSFIVKKVDQYDWCKSWTAPQASPASGLWSSSSTISVKWRAGVQVDSPVKFNKKIYLYSLDNLYKASDVVAYIWSQMTEDEKLSPTLLNFTWYSHQVGN